MVYAGRSSRIPSYLGAQGRELIRRGRNMAHQISISPPGISCPRYQFQTCRKNLEMAGRVIQKGTARRV
jgi:hypothetical protein